MAIFRRLQRATARPALPPSGPPRGGWARSEQPTVTDGQLGARELERGPERANPEGTSLISNPETIGVSPRTPEGLRVHGRSKEVGLRGGRSRLRRPR